MKNFHRPLISLIAAAALCAISGTAAARNFRSADVHSKEFPT
ncbi:MAG: TRAP transporter substrate-binding protein, partial [Ferruginibacter sp.]|nr:TRAP transporter substrate-binding protein [Rhodoferax sp.]